MTERTGIILLAMGGPSSVAEISEYLFNIFSDREIIKLPGGSLCQKPLARMIAKRRTPEVTHNYQRIGGSSPLLRWTLAQAKLLEQELAEDFPGLRSYVGMRYSPPSIATAIEQVAKDGITKLVCLPMYPQFSRATTGSSRSVLLEAVEKLSERPRLRFINDFHAQNDYIALLRTYIAENIGANETLLFSAHSLPQKFVDRGDPYVEQIRKTAELAAHGREHFLSFQSRTGPVKWVGPDTIDEVKRLLSERSSGLFIVPIAFVCDHIETLFEIDLQLKEIVGAEMAARIRRMPMFNDDPRFARVLANLVREVTKNNAGA